jgi:hypothetical protein
MWTMSIAVVIMSNHRSKFSTARILYAMSSNNPHKMRFGNWMIQIMTLWKSFQKPAGLA